jgi:hypothetical protein
MSIAAETRPPTVMNDLSVFIEELSSCLLVEAGAAPFG